MVFSAHGVAPRSYQPSPAALTIDATCPLVTKVHVEARKFAAQGYTIVLIGHAGHEEVEGTMGEAPERIVLRELDDWSGSRSTTRPLLHHADHAVGRRDHEIVRLQERFPNIRAPHRRHLLRHQNRQMAVADGPQWTWCW